MFISTYLKFKVRFFLKNKQLRNSITLNVSPFESFILKITFKMFSNGFFLCNPICQTCSFSQAFQDLCAMCS